MRWCSSLIVAVSASLVSLVASSEEVQTPAAPEAPPSAEMPESRQGEEGDIGVTAPQPVPAPQPLPAPQPEPVPAPQPVPAPRPEVQPQPAPTTVLVAPELSQPAPEPETPEAEGAAEGASPEAGSDESERIRQGGEETWSDALPFRGTMLIYENIFNAYQLNRGADRTYNPYYAMSLSARARWYFRDPLSLRLRFDVEVELTDADDTTDYQETRVSDLTLDLVYNPVYTIPALGVDLGLGVRAVFPTSLQSQAETRYMGLGVDLRLSRTFDVLDGLVIGYVFRYTKYLNRYTTMERETNPYACSPNQPDCLANHQLGDPSRSHGFTSDILLELNFAERVRPMALSFNLIFLNYLTYEVPEATVELMGGQTAVVEHIEDPQNHQASIWFVVDYTIELTQYLALSVGASTLWPQLAPDSTYRTPLFNRYTTVYLDLSLDIERLVAAVRAR
jgi:hypothetical protein